MYGYGIIGQYIVHDRSDGVTLPAHKRCSGGTTHVETSYGYTVLDMPESVKGNDIADILAGKATITCGLRLGRSEVLRSFRHYLRAQSQEHHTIDRLEERERGA